MDSKENNKKIKTAIIELLKFNMVGLFNTAVTYALYSLLVFVGVRDLVALCIEYPIGICISFTLNKKITFRFDHASTGTFLKMVSVYVPALIVNFALLWLFTTKTGLNSYVAQILSLGIVTIASFLFQKYYVFTNKRHE